MIAKPIIRLAAVASFLAAAGCAGPGPSKIEPGPDPAGSGSSMPGYAEVGIERRIAPNGPGAWSELAAWDEYGIVLRNTGSVDVVVTAVELVGGPAGSRWHTTWADSLRKNSRASPDSSDGTGVAQAAGIAGKVIVGVGLSSCYVLFHPAAIPICLVSAATAIPIAQRLKQDQATIDSRGLRLPLGLSPQEEIRGGAFFPISPGSDRLRVHLHIEGEDHVIEVMFRGVAAEGASQSRLEWTARELAG